MQLGRDFNINSISLDSIKVDYEMYGEEKYLRNIASKDVVPDKDFEIAMAVFKEMVIRHCQIDAFMDEIGVPDSLKTAILEYVKALIKVTKLRFKRKDNIESITIDFVVKIPCIAHAAHIKMRTPAYFNMHPTMNLTEAEIENIAKAKEEAFLYIHEDKQAQKTLFNSDNSDDFAFEEED